MLVGRYGLIQSVSTVLVALFTFITIITLLLLQFTEWGVTGAEFSQGLRFQLPPVDVSSAINPVTTALAAFGIIGMGSGELLMYPYWCLEKGYARYAGHRDESPEWISRARGWIRVLRIDAWLSMVVYTFATIVFYLLGAAVLWRTGLNPSSSEMVRTLAEMYVPVFGSWAHGVFLFGAFAVLYSTFFVVAAGYSRMVADAFGLFGFHDRTEASRLRWTRVISVLWPIGALITFVFVRAPVAMILASGVAQAVMLPMLGIAVLYFRYQRSDANLLSGLAWDVMLWLSSVGLFIAGGWSLYSTLSG
jgi:Mn2+/Fe2+ NRAMP family transporter